MHRQHCHRFSVLRLLLISTCLPTLSSASVGIHYLSSDYLKSLDERFFQLRNYSTSDSIVISAPEQVDNSSRFGESFDAFRHSNKAHVIIGAPHQNDKTGATYLCSYKEKLLTFRCDTTKLPLKYPNGENKRGSKGMLLGISVSSATVGDRGFGMYCGHLYHQMAPKVTPKFKGLCNIQSFDNQTRGPLPISVCVGRNCLGGFSSRLSAGIKNSNKLLMAIGAPDLNNGGGVVHVKEVSVDNFSNDSLAGGFLLSNEIRPSTQHIYTGYDTDFAFEKDYSVLVSTITDKNFNGMVEMAERPMPGEKIMSEKIKPVKNPSGGGFGISVASVHFTGPRSQRNDFLVGEPFYVDPTKRKVDVGRVHVYCQRGRIHSIIVGPEVNGRFGYSVSRVPDINRDSLDEFLVGCPYCDDGKGIVFFFFGNKDCVYREADQVIRIADITKHYEMPQPILRFGMSLSTAQDIDGNGVSDLLIGAPISNVVVFARARVSYVVTCSVDTDLKIDDLGGHFRVDAILKSSAKSSSLDRVKLGLRFRFSFDDEKKQRKRLLYQGKSVYYTKEMTIMMKENSQGKVVKIDLVPRDIKLVSENWSRDKTTPLMIRWSIELVSYSASDKFPFPRIVKAGRDWSHQLEKDCFGKCESDFSVQIFGLPGQSNTLLYGSSNITLMVRVINKMPLIVGKVNSDLRLRCEGGLSVLGVYHGVNYKDPLNCISKGDDTEVCYVGQLMTDSVDKDDQQELRLRVVLNAMDLTRKSEWSKLNQTGDPQLIAEVYGSYDSDASNNNDSYSMKVIFDPVNVTMTASSASQQTVIDNRNNTYSVRRRERIHAQRIGPRLSQVYQLINAGRSDIYDLHVNITIPIASELGHRLFYFTNEVRSGGNIIAAGPRVESEHRKSFGKCSLPHELINPLNLTIVTNTQVFRRRMRRSAEIKAIHEKVKSRGKDRVVCGERSKYFGFPKCAEIRCVINQLVRNEIVNILVEGWLWAETTLDQRLKDIEVVTSARGRIAGIPPFATPGNVTHLMIPAVNQTTHFFFENVSPPIIYQFPIWIIILSVIAGIFLLSLIVLCLKKVGFFKRRRRPYAQHQCRFMRYGESVSEMHDANFDHNQSMLNNEDESDLEKLPPDGGSSSRLLPDRTEDVVLFDGQVMGPSSVDTGISDEVESSSSSPKQALEPRDKNYESVSLGMSEENSI